MPNITKYMGRVIPGMSVIQGAWDVGQGVDSLIKGLQRLAAKQSGGPVPMKDIEEWIYKNQITDRDKPEARLDLGADPFDMLDEILSGEKHKEKEYFGAFHPTGTGSFSTYLGAEEKSWIDDLDDFIRQIKAMKKVEKKAEKKK
jgi:hypothetical protein